MRFLLDQDVYAVTARFLAALGHDVLRAAEAGLSRAGDTELLKAANDEGRLFVTRDKDFGGLVFVEGMKGGVLFLRVTPATLDAVHRELARVLGEHGETELAQAFIVVEPGRHRFRRLKVR